MSAERQPTDKLVGQVLAERYQILHRLGEGAMGVVYKARHVKVGRLFAVKVLNARALQDSKVAQRFEREAELAGRLRHPNVAGVVDVGDIDGTRYMVMEFAEGNDLAKLLDEAPMPPERIIGLVRQMLEGLYHAHEQGLIHRDFKPENVIVERNTHGTEVPRIVDFGIALLREGSDASDGVGRLTTNGLVLGTPHYMAPEQAVADPIDHRIDLFALGIVVYEMLSGRLPFDGNGAEVARANLLLDPPPINKRVPHLEVDPLLEAFSRRLMAKRRETRPATAKAARELLDLIERDRPAAAKLLGVPAARSGRAPAVTESVSPDDPTIIDGSSVTKRMKPTPANSQPVAPVSPDAPPPAADFAATSPWAGAGLDPTAGPLPGPTAGPLPGPAAWPPAGAAAGPPAAPWSAAAPPAAPPAPYPGQFARPPAHGPPHAYGVPDRDSTLRTPLSWQASARQNRRRPWLIGGVVVGATSVAAAAIISLTGANPDDPVASDRPAATVASRALGASGSAAAIPPVDPAPAAPPTSPAALVVPPATADTPAATADTPAAATDPAPPAPTADVAAPAITERKRRDPGVDGGRRPSAPPARVRRDADVAPRVTSPAHPDVEPAPTRAPDSAPPHREPDAAAPDPRPGQAAKPPRPEAPHATAPAPVGIPPDELGALFNIVGREIRQLPADEQGDLLGQLARFHIMTELQAAAARRDEVAAQLTQIRDEVRRRRAQHKKP